MIRSCVTPPGFNIEGMAVSPGGDLLFGLRSPLIDGNAVILAANAESLWDQDHEHELELRHLLNLDGLGIRAIDGTTGDQATG